MLTFGVGDAADCLKMGTLKDCSSERRITLGTRCLLGRHPACDVRADEPRVSGEHASVHWINNRWELRDLGSRNGTFLDGRRLASGERIALEEGWTFSLGGPKIAFTLLEAGPPGAAAWNRGSGARRAATAGLLSLPDDERPLASLFQDSSGAWVIETGDQLRQVADQELVEVGGEVFVLELPRVETETWQGEAGGTALEMVHLQLAVSRDEETVRVTVVTGEGAKLLPARSYHYMLLTLARAWLNDASHPSAERGWVDREALCKMLATDLNKLNVDIHRARKQFATLGIEGAGNLVERRPGTGELRIGARSIEVTRL
jgi:pSer/pThr/pTyr-binding forkhead associated (FHA) protein